MVGALLAAGLASPACEVADKDRYTFGYSAGGATGADGGSGSGGSPIGGANPGGGGMGGGSGLPDTGGTAGTPTNGGAPIAGGTAGDTGTQGEAGDTGTQGEAGDTGTQGEAGDTGTRGEAGDTGAAGHTGAGGKPGSGGATSDGGGGGTAAMPSGGGGSGGRENPAAGYLTSGSWKGFAWTATSGQATISPEDYDDVTDWPVCAKGTVAGDFASVALVGWNLNQEPAADAPPGTITPTLEGITIRITAYTPAPLRIQLHGENGETNPDHRWCADIGTGGDDLFVPYTSFNTECWSGQGNAYDGEPLSYVSVQVPGGSIEIHFDFCINSIAETAG